jgi:hypothetical protein
VWESEEVSAMTSTNMKAKIVRVKVDQGKAGLFYATSPDLKGLLVAMHSLEEINTAIPAAITDLYAAVDVKVVVTPVDDDTEEFTPWVAISAEVARRAMGMS